MISKDSIQQVVGRIDIIEIVSDFVRLKRRGANYLGLCPFHDEKTPSFTVSPTKEIYKCFGCGRSGNAITFLMEHEKYSYVEAIRWLAQRYNIELEETESSPEYKQQQQVADSLYIINNFAQEHFSHNLTESDEGKSIGLSYLRERGFRDHIIKKFELGYCLNDNSFSKEATARQFNRELLVKSGLVVSRDGQLRDNYRGRIIFPIHNQSGKTVGFGARLIEKNDRAPKYINTPENEIYVKSRILYGLWQARQTIGKKDECILVEGYTDVVSLHQAGIENVVASGGTSLTKEQLHLIRKFTPNLTIFYDGDAAGTAAALRGLDLALEEGLTVKVVSLPSPEDPDSYIQKYGAAALETYIAENKKDFILFQINYALTESGDDHTKKTEAVKKIAESISKLNRPEDFIIKQEYIKQVAGQLAIDEEGLITLINSITRENLQKLRKRAEFGDQKEEPGQAFESSLKIQEDEEDSAPLIQNRDYLHERALVRCLLEYGEKEWDGEQTVADYLLKENNIDAIISHPELQEIITFYHNFYERGKLPDIKEFLYSENQQLTKEVISLVAFPYEVSKNWAERYNQEVPEKEDLYKADVSSSLRYIELRNTRKMLLENEKSLKENKSPEELIILVKTQQALKSREQFLAKEIGAVIIK